jgi:hypothetical protein
MHESLAETLTYLDITLRFIGMGRREMPLEGSLSPGTSGDYGLHPWDNVGNGPRRETVI